MDDAAEESTSDLPDDVGAAPESHRVSLGLPDLTDLKTPSVRLGETVWAPCAPVCAPTRYRSSSSATSFSLPGIR